jgi:hypothetical protein
VAPGHESTAGKRIKDLCAAKAQQQAGQQETGKTEKRMSLRQRKHALKYNDFPQFVQPHCGGGARSAALFLSCRYTQST